MDISDSRSAESQSVISGDSVKSLDKTLEAIVVDVVAAAVAVVVGADVDGCCSSCCGGESMSVCEKDTAVNNQLSPDADAPAQAQGLIGSSDTC